MRKRRKTLVFVLCVSALLTLILIAARDNQPTHQGRSLEYWLKVYDPWETAFVTPERTEAEEAVRHIGTNALPFLLKWIHYEPHDWQKRLANAIGRLPEPARSSAVLHSTTYSSAKRNRSVLARAGFQILGEDAAPAIPDLVRLLHATNSVSSRGRVAHALAFTGRAGLPPLLDALSDTNFPNRGMVCSAIFLSRLGTNASPAVPALIRCMQDSDPNTATMAVQTLASLCIEPDTAVPALTNAFAAEDKEVRYWAVHAFSVWLRDYADQAAPALRGMLNDPDYRIREDASKILARIDTEAVTNAPAQ